MKKYLSLIKSQIKLETAYNTIFWASLFTATIRLLVIYYFWLAVFNSGLQENHLDFQSLLTYMTLSLILFQYMDGSGQELSESIRSGSISLELIKPYNYMHKLFFMDIGKKITIFFRSTIPLLIISILFLGINGPSSLLFFSLFVISIVLAILIGTQFDLLFNTFAFWTINIWGLRVFKSALVSLFSGSLIPLYFFSDFFQNIGYILPFRGMIYVPISIYIGSFSFSQALIEMGYQLVWFILLYIVVQKMWSLAQRRIIIYGG